MLNSNKIIAAISVFIVIDLAIISYLLVEYRPSDEAVYVEGKRVTVSPPKIGFAEIITRSFPQVLSAKTLYIPTPSPVPVLSKKTYIIAAIGDSMIQTMGPNLDYLQKDLLKKYPRNDFVMYNYGVGGEKVTSGLARLNAPFELNGRSYPPLSELKPDILIVGSYAYNPFAEFDLNLYTNQLTELVNRSRSMSGKVYMMAEIAPLAKGFGVGPGGVNWPENLAQKQTLEIESQMQKVFEVSKYLTVPVIDIYDRSKVWPTSYGQPRLVNTYDGIHPSVEGQEFTAQIITDSLEFK